MASECPQWVGSGARRNGWKADEPGTSPLRSNGEGDRSAQLSGGGASDGRAEAIDAVGDAIGIGKHVGRQDA
jgi:hypothetical protein